MRQAYVGDLGATEIETLQRHQPCEVWQARVGDLGAIEMEKLQRR